MPVQDLDDLARELADQLYGMPPSEVFRRLREFSDSVLSLLQWHWEYEKENKVVDR